MKIIEIIRLLLKHWILLLITPVLLALLAVYFTRHPDFTYTSETTLYTGIASGSTIEMDKTLNYFATNTAFDNLINIIKSRETQQEVALSLLAQHLLMDHYNPKFLSHESYEELKRITPSYIYALLDREMTSTGKAGSTPGQIPAVAGDTSISVLTGSRPNGMADLATLPPAVDQEAFTKTVENLKNYMAGSDTNFVYELLSYDHRHYSIKAVAKLNVQRIGTSDLVKLRFEADDPGICQQTLYFYSQACARNYKLIKENRSDAVVKYFENQLQLAAEKLRISEDKLLKFNEDNNIINYYEQSKAVAVVKEDLEVEYNKMQMKLAGAKAAIQRIEDKLGTREQIQLKSTSVIEKRNRLGEIQSRIATAEIVGPGKAVDPEELQKLRAEAGKLKDDIRNSVNELYVFGNTIEGLPVSRLLLDWIDNVIVYEDTRASMEVMQNRINEFQKQYEIYAPAGANVKRIEREINVSEQEFLEILHGLNLAKLKLQDIELASNIKTVDPPFYPLTPNPTKRKMLVLVAAMLGFFLVLTAILAMEYLDDTLKNPKRTIARTGLKPAGVFPKIFLRTGTLNFPFIANRVLEVTLQNLGFYGKEDNTEHLPHEFLIFSSMNQEGKTVVGGNLALKMKKQGKKVLFLNYSRESLRKTELSQTGYSGLNPETSQDAPKRRKQRYPLLSRLFGYEDHRVDHDSPFLRDPSAYLDKDEYLIYEINSAYYSASHYRDLLPPQALTTGKMPDFVLIELPPVLFYQFPVNIMSSAGTLLMVCRANRTWSPADEEMLANIRKLASKEPCFLLNGVELPVIESVLGDLPKKRSRVRRMIKKIVRLQFFHRNQI